MTDWVDTILNIATFAFIALLIWLLVKPIDPIRPNDEEG